FHQIAAQRAEAICAHVERAGRAAVEHEHVRVHEIVRMNELEEHVPAPHHVNVATLANPFEQDLEDAEAPFAQDGARPNDDEPNVRAVADLANGLLAGELATAIDLDGVHGGVGGDRTLFGSAEDRAGAHVHERTYPGLDRFLGGDARSVDVDLPELR